MLQVFLAFIIIVFLGFFFLMSFTRKSDIQQLNEKPKTQPSRQE